MLQLRHSFIEIRLERPLIELEKELSLMDILPFLEENL